MAKGGRKYARDNRGRFASTGATARGGRLRTAAGNKRATVTAGAKGGNSGTISKPRGLAPGSIKPKNSRTSALRAKAVTGGIKRPTGQKQATNGVSPSPRRLDSAEKAYVQILGQKSKFRSDTKQLTELSRMLGRKVSLDEAFDISNRAMSKLGVKPSTLPTPSARKAAIDKYLGKSKARKRK